MRSVSVLTAILLCATGASAQLLWTPTATQGIGLPNFTVAAQQLGPLPDTTPVHVLLALKPRNASQLASTIVAVNTPGNASYGKFLTPAQFAATYSPSASQVQAVSQYLSQMGFTGISAPGNRLYVEARGTAGQAKAAFNTPINQFRISGPGTAPARTVYANAAAAQVPAALAGNVTAVIGLSNVDTMHTRLGRWPSAAGTQAGVPAVQPTFSPQDFWKVYDVGATPAAANTTIAIFAEGDLTGILPDPNNAAAVNDLRQFEAEYGLPEVPVTIVKTGIGSTDVSGAVEWDMDTQESTGLAGNVARLIVYDGDSLADTDLVPEFNRFVTDNLAQAGSASFGGCEILQELLGSTALYSTIFSQAAAQGQTIFASSGDAGSACSVVGVTNGVPAGVEGQVEFPASSTYVVAVGGTTLIVDADFNVVQTTAWDAGGGGTSLFEPAGSWQTGFVATAAIAKGVPDLAMDADFLASPAGFVSGGADTSNGGTSLASPLALGAWARLQSAHGNALGFAAPVLYSQAAGGTPLSTTGKMTDIILGTNGLFVATPGWDFTTGLGSFDIAALNGALH